MGENIQAVKKILEHYFSEELGVGASDDIAEEICQLIDGQCDNCTDWDWIQKHQYKSTNITAKPS